MCAKDLMDERRIREADIYQRVTQIILGKKLAKAAGKIKAGTLITTELLGQLTKRSGRALSLQKTMSIIKWSAYSSS